ncbi:hypothetical protein F4X86_04580 [Candidatus Saccharibacteria bacterium]|nr:hypothetical protein [Candidatus Saccharibacteria bacterium]
MNEVATIPETVRKSKRDAVLLALMVGAPAWLYTYDQDKVKLWLGVALQAAVLLIGYVFVLVIIIEANADSNSGENASLTEIVNFVRSTDSAKYALLGVAFLLSLIHGIALLDRAAKPAKWYARYPRNPMSKIAAILLAVFTYHFTWLYTYDRDKAKFWIGYLLFALYFTVIFFIPALPNSGETADPAVVVPILLSVALIVFMLLGLWVWGIVNSASRSDDWYRDYPYRRSGRPSSETSVS